jgi:hypothetical protein
MQPGTLVLEEGGPLHIIWDVPRFCAWFLAQPDVTGADEALGADYRNLTLRDAIDVLPRALRYGEITDETVESVFAKIRLHQSPDDANMLREQYEATLARQREVNGK